MTDFILNTNQEHHRHPNAITALEQAIRNLAGHQRGDVVARLPQDIQQELIDLGYGCSCPPQSLAERRVIVEMANRRSIDADGVVYADGADGQTQVVARTTPLL